MESIAVQQAPSKRYLANPPRLAFAVFSLLVGACMAWAWSIRDHRYIEAESGLGYVLGITGASLMLLLLLYPLRKRARFMRGWLNLAVWFRLHMFLGVLGPLCILLHCNFQLGSANSSVALVCMLLVAGSGLIGRYLYGKFHYGLYGQQVELHQLRRDLDYFYRDLQARELTPQQQEFAHKLYEGCGGIIAEQQSHISLRQLLRQRRWLGSISRELRSSSGPGQVLLEQQRALAGLLDRLAGLRLFERLFSFWHVAHIPVFLLMVVTAIVHVVVVHLY